MPSLCLHTAITDAAKAKNAAAAKHAIATADLMDELAAVIRDTISAPEDVILASAFAFNAVCAAKEVRPPGPAQLSTLRSGAWRHGALTEPFAKPMLRLGRTTVLELEAGLLARPAGW